MYSQRLMSKNSGICIYKEC